MDAIETSSTTPDVVPVVQTVGFSRAPTSVYYERLAPADGSSRATIVMIHGGGGSGVYYRVTPDGRRGWADLFASWGYTVYVPDWPGHGRSGFVPEEDISYPLVVEGLAGLVGLIDEPVVLLTHSMSGPLGWKLTEMVPDRVAQVVAIAPGPPGNIMPSTPGDNAFAGPPLELVEETDERVVLRRAGIDVVFDLTRRMPDSTCATRQRRRHDSRAPTSTTSSPRTSGTLVAWCWLGSTTGARRSRWIPRRRCSVGSPSSW